MIRIEEGNQREQLFDMWHRIFHDTIPYTEYYFNEIYGHNEILLEEKEGQLRGMLHLNPYTMQMGEDRMNAHYIVGVSTEEEYRRQGVMRNLLLESFDMLRKRGEVFTYLMPAQEEYYLPFSFRFGMMQYEQELRLGASSEVDQEYTFARITEEEYEKIVSIENVWKKERYAISTEISPEYLRRFGEEVRSEFGIFFCVKKAGQIVGRFVAYAENDSISICQMVCYSVTLRKEFLQQIIRFCDGRYHFRQYKITYPEDWKEELLQSKDFDELHIFHTKEHPIIMFRILNLEPLSKWLRCSEEVSCILMVKDEQIPDQEGSYLFQGNEQGMLIKKLSPEELDRMGGSNGTVEIADLTSHIFGGFSDKDHLPQSFDEKAAGLWKSMLPLTPIEIPEIV